MKLLFFRYKVAQTQSCADPQCAAALQLPEPLVSLVSRWRSSRDPPLREHLASPRVPAAASPTSLCSGEREARAVCRFGLAQLKSARRLRITAGVISFSGFGSSGSAPRTAPRKKPCVCFVLRPDYPTEPEPETPERRGPPPE